VSASGWFLCVAVVGLVFTLNALAPRRRPTSLVGVSFFSAWLTTELAEIHLVWQAVAIGLFVAAGALHAWTGDLALALTALSWIGLVHIVTLALRTRAFIDDALRDLPPLEAVTPVRSPFRRAIARNPRRAGVEKIKNLAYVDDGDRRHRLDVYRPKVDPEDGERDNAGAGAPVLLQIHGGGWMIGEKKQQGLPLMYQLASRGWVCVAINYRLSPRATWPDHLIDCKQALAWVKQHIAEYGGDPARVVVTGGSAGGHLTAMLGLTANDARFQPGFEDVDTSVRAFVPVYAVYDFTDRNGIRGKRDALRWILEKRIVKLLRDANFDVFDLASPMSHVHDGVPPCFVIHGSLDNLVPVEEARAFVGLLRAASTAPVAYAELAGAHHAFDVFPSLRSVLMVDGVERFASWAVSDSARSVAARSADGAPASATGPTTTAHTEPSPTLQG
jgi:acetyl esterase/lipase